MLYLQRRAEIESTLAERSEHDAVKAVHRQFAELYRARLAGDSGSMRSTS